MDFSSILGNIGSKIKSFFTGGGQDLSANIGSFAQKNVGYTPPPPVIPPAVPFENYTPAPNVSLGPNQFGFADSNTGKITRMPGALPPPVNIRPINPTIPVSTVNTDPTKNPSFSGAYQSPEQKAQTEAQRQATLRGKTGQPGASTVIPYTQTNYGSQYIPSPSNFPIAGLSGVGGTTSGSQAGRTAASIGSTGITLDFTAASDETTGKYTKQPQFYMVSLDQARQMGLKGSGTSGILTDNQGNFYGISNVNIANRFSAPDTSGRITVTPQQIEGQPFQASTSTAPISAEGLLKGASQTYPTTQDITTNFQNQINLAASQQPSVPSMPVVPTQAQQNFYQGQDLKGQQIFDYFQQQLGIPQKNSEIINYKNQLANADQALKKVMDDIHNNPNLPVGLAERMIKNFVDNTYTPLYRDIESRLTTAEEEKSMLDSEFNQRLGIYEKEEARSESQAEKDKNDAFRRLEYFTNSGVTISDDEANRLAQAIGGGVTPDMIKQASENKATLNSLKTQLETYKAAAAAGGETKGEKRESAVSQYLDSKKGKDGFVSAASYQEALKKWIAEGGTQSNFFASFPQQNYLGSWEIPKLPSALQPTRSQGGAEFNNDLSQGIQAVQSGGIDASSAERRLLQTYPDRASEIKSAFELLTSF